jgi:serine/threonine protein kinase/Flp pilus assembly protein TadD
MTERDLFIAARGMPDSSERAAFLAEACGGDANLRHQVETLLGEQDALGSFLEEPAIEPADTAIWPATVEQISTLIGPYKLVEQIGEGGFGVVYMAEQQQPVRRKVALKVIKPGMDTRQVIARFEAERQALALMEHVNIARVLDGGTTGAGRPYFVMELVRGVPITDYCDQNRLPPRRRLDLFLSVCRAAQHAHHKGVIHRDLKPSNILVTLHDGVPVPKLIDFGIAKAIGQQLTDKTLFTGCAQLVGTPLYMSPEQAELSGLDIDTRTDVYALGVLLYELLTGRTPFDEDKLRAAGYDEFRRIIREEEPPKPSARVSTLGKAAATVSARRQSDPRQLGTLLRGELDWIVMKAMEKDRNRRYETAAALAADVERYLRDEPVEAGPPSAFYRVRTFVRRHRAGLATAAAAAAALMTVLAAVAGSVGWALRDRAMREAALDADVSRAVAEVHLLTADGQLPDAWAAVERTEKLLRAAGRQTLPPSLLELQRDLAMALRLEDIYSQPRTEVVASGRKEDRRYARGEDDAYAQAFRDYGLDLASLPVADATEQIRSRGIRLELARALDLWSAQRRRAGSEGPPDWKQLLEVAKAADPDDWRNALREAMQRDDRRCVEELAASADVHRLPAATLALLGRTLADYLRAPTQAVALLRQAQREYPGDLWINATLGWYCFSTISKPQYDDAARFYAAAVAARPRSAFLRNCLGRVLSAKGSFAEAAAEFSKAIELRSDYPAPWFNRGVAYARLKRWDDALASCREGLRLQPDHPDAHHSLGLVLRLQGHLAEAEAAFREAVRLRPGYATFHCELGDLFRQQGNFSGAEAAYRDAILLKPQWPPYHYSLGLALGRQGKWVDAEAAYRDALRLKPGFAGGHFELGLVLERLGRHAEAEGALREAVRLAPDSARVHNQLAWLLVACADSAVWKPDDAVALAERAVALAPNNASYWNTLGVARYRAGDFKAAIPPLEKSMGLSHGGDSLDWFFLAATHWQLGRRDEARNWYDRAVAWMDRNRLDDPNLRRVRDEVAELLGVKSKTSEP